LTAGFIALAAGLIPGSLTCGVLKGNELPDETQRTVQEKTRQILHEANEQAGHAVEAARLAGREEAERQNPMPP